LESTYPSERSVGMQLPQFGLEGESDKLAVTALMPVSGGTGGMRRFEILLRAQSDGSKNLIVRSSLGGNSAAVSAREEVLIDRVKTVQWAYLEPVDPAAVQIRSDPAWIDSWIATRRPPGLVRLRVFFPPADPRVWPELIVAPRITDDANCEFDVVAQACRENQS
jgi:general secretion pathway protein J